MPRCIKTLRRKCLALFVDDALQRLSQALPVWGCSLEGFLESQKEVWKLTGTLIHLKREKCLKHSCFVRCDDPSHQSSFGRLGELQPLIA